MKANKVQWLLGLLLPMWSFHAAAGAQMSADAQTSAAKSQPPIPIKFTLQEPGFVTLVIEDAQGKRVRNLVSETPFPAGANVAYWDGLDDVGRDPEAAEHGIYHVPGKLVAPGAYRVRGLVRPTVEARYVMTPYTEGRPPWKTADKASEWLSNHTPPSSILFVPGGEAPVREAPVREASTAPARDWNGAPLAAPSGVKRPPYRGGQVLVGSYIAEGGSGLAWLDAEGRKLYGQMWIGGVWTGAQYLARDAGTNRAPGVYAYTASAWANELRLYELRKEIGSAPRDTRMGFGDDQPVLSPRWEFPGSTSGAWNSVGETAAVAGLAVRDGLIAVALPKLNQVLFVDGKARQAIGTVPVSDPRGLSFDARGRLLALSGSRLLRYTLPVDLKSYVTTGMYQGEPLDKSGWKAASNANPDAARLAIDNDFNTRWESRESQRPGTWFTLDLGTPRTFNRVALNNTGSGDFPRGYEMYASPDGQNWGRSIVSGQGTGTSTLVSLPTTTTRYLKLVQTGENRDSWWSINELTLLNRPENYAAPQPKPLPAPQILVARGLDDPYNLAVAPDGRIFISDRGGTSGSEAVSGLGMAASMAAVRGGSHNVKVFGADGKYLRAIGKPGTPRPGAYDPLRMNNPAGLTLDDKGRLWVAEDDFQPKRLSVWDAATGKLLRAFYGPQRYGGGGQLDPREPNTYYYDSIKFKLNPATGGTVPLSVLYRQGVSSPWLRLGSSEQGPQTAFYVNGRQYMTNAYSANPTNGSAYAYLWRVEGGAARPAAAMGGANSSPILKGLVRHSRDFSARWTGQIKAPATGTYTFTVEAGGTARLWLGTPGEERQKILDYWDGPGEHRGSIALEAGRRYDVQLEYRQRGSGASLKFEWEGPNTPRQLVPASALYADTRAATPPGALAGQYWETPNLTDYNSPATTVEGPLDFNWNEAAPAVFGVPGDARSNARFKNRLPADWQRGDPLAFCWSDGNDDGQMQPEEVVFIKGASGGVTVLPDLSFVFQRLGRQALRFKPLGFTRAGAPRYDAARGEVLVEGAQEPSSSGGQQVLVGRDGWSVHTTPPQPFSTLGLAGVQNGVAKWSYPSTWPGLHASHHAPLPEMAGELIGTTRLLGTTVTPRGTDAEVWAVNGNKGNIYLLTTDGLFVATLFKDSRQASWSFPAEKRGMLMNDASAQEESFWPFISQTADGHIYLTVNGSIVRLDGLEKLRRLPASALNVSAPMLAQAQQYFVQREAARQREKQQGPLTVAIKAQAPGVDGNLDEWQSAQWALIDTRRQQEGDWGSRETRTQAALAVAGDRLYAAFKTDDAGLLRNQPEALQNLFKTGGALDLMVGTRAGADPNRSGPVVGDVRLLVTRVGDKTTAVLYRPVAPGSTSEPAKFVSMLGANKTTTIDRVDNVSDQIQLASDNKGSFELSIPLAVLGLEPKPGLTLKGDIGILRGNGFQTLQRVYWNNKATGLTSDLASEAELTPQLWGQFEFKAAL